MTATATATNADVFYVAQNVLNTSSQQSVSIYVAYTKAGSPFSLRVYNSAGEFIRDLTKDENLTSTPVDVSFHWDGRNWNHDLCASGVYVLYLIEPYDRKYKRLLIIR
jgi:flagellar hook assembly protein FlgD